LTLPACRLVNARQEELGDAEKKLGSVVHVKHRGPIGTHTDARIENRFEDKCEFGGIELNKQSSVVKKKC
jgi:hypothetical protein